MTQDRREFFATDRVAHVSLQDSGMDGPFHAGDVCSVCVPVADVHPDPDTPRLDRQLLFGTDVIVLEQRGTRAFLRDETMGYVGWVDDAALGPHCPATHRVSTMSSFCFDSPDFKSPKPVHLPNGARVCVDAREGRYAQLAKGGFMIAEHLTPLALPVGDPVCIAETHLGVPYLWGGNSSFGIDCSGLVQVSLAAAHQPCPGDSDQQERALGRTVPEGTAPRRGDLFFWKGHVAWVADAQTLLHANAHHMRVAFEPIAEARARIASQGGGGVTRHARLA